MITGYFMSVEVPEVAVGQDIKATIDFSALNPGALYWSTFLVADSPALGLRRLLDKAREIGQEGGREKTYTLGQMPDKDVAISFFIFAHDDAGYDWDWGEYQDWMIGYPIELTHLDSDYKFLSPVEEPPEPPEPPGPADVSGIIMRAVPSQFVIGQPIDLEIDFNAYMEDLYYQVRGWETSLQAIVDGKSDSDAQNHWGRDGSRTGEKLHLGAMPNRILTGELTLYGRGMAIPQHDWQKLDTKNLVLTPTGELPPECSIDSDCPTGYVCRDGVCVPDEVPPECSIDSDCPPGYWCLNGVCVPEVAPPPTCSIDSDCPEGYVCKDGVCVKKQWWQTGWMVPAVIVAATLLLIPGKKTKKGK